MNPARKPLRALHGLRFFAAFHIVAFHFAPVTEGTALALFVHRGPTSVSLFFVLSGFVLAYNYLNPAAPLRVGAKAFWGARFARIYPVYLLGLFIGAPAFVRRVAAVDGWTRAAAVHTAEIGAAVILLLQAWIPDAACMWNCPGWSLSAEAFFCLLFPWLAAPFVRWTRRRIVLGTGAWLSAGALLQIGSWLTFDRLQACGDPWAANTWLRVGEYNPIVYVPQFFVGVGVGRLFSQQSQESSAPRWAPWMGPLALGGIIRILTLSWSEGSPPLMVADLWLTPLYALLVWSLACGTGSLARLLALQGPVVLGEASYALYLLHGPIHNLFQVLEASWAAHGAPRLSFWVYAAGSVAASIAVFFRFEEPARRWLRRRVGVPRSVPRTVGSTAAS